MVNRVKRCTGRDDDCDLSNLANITIYYSPDDLNCDGKYLTHRAGGKRVIHNAPGWKFYCIGPNFNGVHYFCEAHIPKRFQPIIFKAILKGQTKIDSIELVDALRNTTTTQATHIPIHVRI